MAAAGAEGRTMRRALGNPPEGPGKTQGVAFRRSRGPRSRLQRAFRLTNIRLRGTVEPGDGGYPGNLGWIRELPACAPL